MTAYQKGVPYFWLGRSDFGALHQSVETPFGFRKKDKPTKTDVSRTNTRLTRGLSPFITTTKNTTLLGWCFLCVSTTKSLTCDISIIYYCFFKIGYLMNIENEKSTNILTPFFWVSHIRNCHIHFPLFVRNPNHLHPTRVRPYKKIFPSHVLL